MIRKNLSPEMKRSRSKESRKNAEKKLSPEMKRSRPTESQKIIEKSLKTPERFEIFIFVVFRISK